MSNSVVIDIEGTELTSADRDLFQHPDVGGMILFSRNYANRDQLRELVADIRDVNSELLIAVDQEGGRVQRFREGFECLPALQKIGDLCRYNSDQTEQICFSMGWLMATDILETGIDISFAPVVDLDKENCPAISDRSFSENPEEAIKMAAAYIEGMSDAGMAATAKHFPGHGRVSVDSHESLPVDARNYIDIQQNDMQPFEQLAEIYHAVMPGHILFPEVDSQPVGFSKLWLQKILRTDLGFKGVIFSDDLSMGGAAASGSYRDRAELALEAGCDMLLACNNRTGALEILEYTQSIDLEDRSEKLALMRAKKNWALSEIRSSSHYTRAKEYLAMIEELG